MDLSYLLPDLQLANPLALFGLAALPLWLVLAWRARRRTGGLRFPHAGLMEGLPGSWRVRLLWVPDALRALALALLILAVARPQFGRETETTVHLGVDIMLALDVSGSMRAEDIPPNRMEAAKAVTIRFVERLEGNRVGLVVFAGRSFTQCPLTTDHGILIELLQESHIGMVRFNGTAIGDALANCLYRFDLDAERRGTAPEAEERSRVVVLLTDGVNNTGRFDPLEAAAMARVKGVRVHVIGFGTSDGAPVPWYEGGRRTYLQRPDGTVHIEGIDERAMQEIADLTGGRYFPATGAEVLDQVYAQIAELERHEIEVQRITHHEERFYLLVLLALAVLLVELLLRSTSLRVTA